VVVVRVESHLQPLRQLQVQTRRLYTILKLSQQTVVAAAYIVLPVQVYPVVRRLVEPQRVLRLSPLVLRAVEDGPADLLMVATAMAVAAVVQVLRGLMVWPTLHQIGNLADTVGYTVITVPGALMQAIQLCQVQAKDILQVAVLLVVALALAPPAVAEVVAVIPLSTLQEPQVW
jgi:hypothetical protein